MESLLSIILYIPFYSRKIQNKYITNFLFVAIFLFVLLTFFVSYDVNEISMFGLTYSFYGLKSTKYFILLIVGLLSQLVLYHNSKLNYKDYTLQGVSLLWFGLVNNSPLVLCFGFIFISIISLIFENRNITYKALLLFLLIISFMQQRAMFDLGYIYSHLLISIPICLLIINLKSIQSKKFNSIGYYFYLILLVYVSSTAKQLDVDFKDFQYLYVLPIILINRSLYVTVCRLIVYFVSLGFLFETIDIYSMAPVIFLLFLMPKTISYRNSKLSEYKKLILVLILLIMPFILKKSFIIFESVDWILNLLFIVFLSISVKEVVINGLDLKNKSVQLCFGLIITALIITGIEKI
jgi:hypothetical protein